MRLHGVTQNVIKAYHVLYLNEYPCLNAKKDLVPTQTGTITEKVIKKGGT